MKADLIVTNARVLTMDATNPRAEAVAVAGAAFWRWARGPRWNGSRRRDAG